MTTETITFRVDATERADILARAERDNVSPSDYIRVRLGLRGEGSPTSDSVVAIGADEAGLRAQLADHGRRLDALEAGRSAAATP